MKRIKEMEKQLVQCEKDFEKMKTIHKELKRIEANRKVLDEYYKNQYVKDYEKKAGSNENYRVLNQDSIWNVLSDQYSEKIKLLKTITKSI